MVAETDPLPAADRAAGVNVLARRLPGRARGRCPACGRHRARHRGRRRPGRPGSAARRPAGLDREPAAGTRQAADVLVAFLDLPAPAAGRHQTGHLDGARPGPAAPGPLHAPRLLRRATGPGRHRQPGPRRPARGPRPERPRRRPDQYGARRPARPRAAVLARRPRRRRRRGDGVPGAPHRRRPRRPGPARRPRPARARPPPSRLRTCRPSSLTRRTAAPGFRLLPQGTPTNNTGSTPSALGTVDEDAARFAALTPPAPVPPGDWAAKTDGQWLAELLGIDPAVVAAVPGADGTDQREARAMNAALWPATWGYQLGTMLNPILGTAALDATRAFFLRYVSGRGPLPAVRVGRQPYGVLATTAFSRLAWPDADPLTPHRRALDTVLKVADGDWASLADQVAFVGADGDPHALLLGILGLHPTSAEFYQRYAQSVEDYFNRFNLAGAGGDRARRAPRPRPRAAPAQPAHPARVPRRRPRPRRGDPALRRAPAPLARAARRRPPAVGDGNRPGLDGRRAQLPRAGSRPTPARRSTSSGPESGFTAATPPVAVLYLLLRHAVLEAYAEAALRLAAAAHALSDADVVRARREPPFVHVSERTQVTREPLRAAVLPRPGGDGGPRHARRGLHSGDHRAAAGGPGPRASSSTPSACSRRCPRRASNARSSSTSTAPPTGWTPGGSVSPPRSSSSCATRRRAAPGAPAGPRRPHRRLRLAGGGAARAPSPRRR